MKKMIILMIAMLVLAGFGFGQEQKAHKSEEKKSESEIITKTYVLQHVSPVEAEQTLRQYFFRSSFHPTGNMLTVTISKENIAKFEELLKQLDAEKKKILIRIFTIVATKVGKSGDIPNKDLQQVLEELQKVLSFKAFHLDGVSAITVKDGQRHSELRLSSLYPLSLRLEDVSLKGDKQNERSIEFEFQLRLYSEPKILKESQRVYETLIQSQTSVKENGYLVAGVSKINNGDSLVLVINAEIK